MNILVVDDEADIKPLFEQRFRKETQRGEFNLAFAYSGTEAFGYMQQHPSELVLILTDINMPGMNGMELLRQIRARFTSPPPVIVMITAYSDDALYEQAMRYGANDFLTKPLDFGMLKNKLKVLII